jgi:formylglycine-generating enzyme required for sulfatase activity
MVLIPENGSFAMGCVAGDSLCTGDESPSHLVTLSPYFIDIAEVTAGEYAACVEALGCLAPTNTDVYDPASSPNWPVTGMSRDSAAAYCEWNDMKRLPTEAEWEKAARGTSAANIYPWGVDAPGCLDKAQFKLSTACEPPTPADVKSFASGTSDYGLYDMSGNVWEWVSDWNGPYLMDAVRDPQGPDSAPVSGETGILRGGGWRTGSVEYIRVSNRNTTTHTVSSNTYGMRCAKGVL